MTQRDNRTVVDVLRYRAATQPDRIALEFLAEDRPNRTISYAMLDRRARTIATALLRRGTTGDRALLLYPPGPDYVLGFLGCLYAGMIAVPVALPGFGRGSGTLAAIAADADAAFALCDGVGSAATGELAAIRTDQLAHSALQSAELAQPAPADTAFLQYTSGTTGSPKGVVVRHDNVMHNLAKISRAIGVTSNDSAVSWLPPYHDMGLVGGILQPLYAGIPVRLMSPDMFLRRPSRWLAAISDTSATISVAPDFGYAECVRRTTAAERAAVDLSTWRCALIGSEPIRPGTIDEFAAAFVDRGFRRAAFTPCYGLAEATLLVTGDVAAGGPATAVLDREMLDAGHATPGSDVSVVSCGPVAEGDLVVVVAADTGRRCAPAVVGEVWISGPSVTAGYWRRPAETATVFDARSADLVGRSFLRTGDLGFERDGELYLVGRQADRFVIRGRNHYRVDVERTAQCCPEVVACAAFTVVEAGQDQVVLVCEVGPPTAAGDRGGLVTAIQQAVVGEHGVAPHAVVLVRRGAIPRTTSGKIRREACRDRWLAGSLRTLSGTTATATPAPDSELARLVVAAMGTATAMDTATVRPAEDVPLVGLGLDSLAAVRLAAQVRRAFGVEPPVARLLGGLTLGELDEWLRGATTSAVVRPMARETTAATSATAAQHWMWLLDQRIGASGACHIVGGVRFDGPLKVDLLRECLTVLIRRHRILRSTFHAVGDAVRVSVGPGDAVDLAVIEAIDPRPVIDGLAGRPFDLANDRLLRAVLVRTGPRAWCLGIVAHHVIVDGWSLGLLLDELGACYRDLVAGRPVVVESRQQPIPVIRNDESEAFWRHTLAGAVPVTIPPDGPGHSSPTASAVPFELDAELVEGVTEHARAQRATPFMVLLAGFACVLARWTDRSDVLIGTPAAGRHDPELVDRIGLFVNIIPLRIAVPADADLTEVTARSRTACLAAYPHQTYPYEANLRNGQDGHLVQVVLALQNLPMTPWDAGELHAEPFELPAPGAQFDLYLRLTRESNGTIAGHAIYPTDRYRPVTIQAIVDTTLQVYRALAGDPHLPVRALPMPARAGRVVRQPAGLRDEPVDASGYTPPRDDLERRLAQMWAAILAVPVTSVTADFFDLGGHSLAATRLVMRVRYEFGVELAIDDLLDGGLTVANLAELVRTTQIAEAGPDDLKTVLDHIGELSDQQVDELLSHGRSNDS